MISTPAQLARKVVSKTSDSVNKKAANDVVQNKLRKIGSSSNAIADEEKTITVDVGDNDGTDTIMPELAPEGTDNNGTDANAASTTSTTVESAPALLDEPLGIFERPSTHRKYHTIERDSDSGENRLSKVASDAAQVRQDLFLFLVLYFLNLASCLPPRHTLFPLACSRE
jgi:hypothetical protein